VPSGSLGLFFNPPASATRTTGAITGWRLCQFASAFGNGVNTQARDPGETAVATMPQFLGLQADIQPSLAFIQRADQEIHVLVQVFDRMGAASAAVGTLTVMQRSLRHEPSPREKWKPA